MINFPKFSKVFGASYVSNKYDVVGNFDFSEELDIQKTGVVVSKFLVSVQKGASGRNFGISFSGKFFGTILCAAKNERNNFLQWYFIVLR